MTLGNKFSIASGRKISSVSHQRKGVSASRFVGWSKVTLLALSKLASSKRETIPSMLAQQRRQALMRATFRLPQVQHCPNTATALSVYSWLTSGCFRAQACLCLQINSETCLKIQSRNPKHSWKLLIFPTPSFPFFLSFLFFPFFCFNFLGVASLQEGIWMVY